MYDLIIKNGSIYDGTERKPFIADVGIPTDEEILTERRQMKMNYMRQMATVI